MSKGKRREREEEKRERTKMDLKEHKGLSKYERKKLAQQGIVVEFPERQP
jgi:hypothetical protein